MSKDKNIPVLDKSYSNLVTAKQAMFEGRNILEVLRNLRDSKLNSVDEIEISYDLQSGSYSNQALLNVSEWRNYGELLASHLQPHVDGSSSFLDCGTGELTSLTSIDLSGVNFGEVFAMDLSWSRLSFGQRFVRDHASDSFHPTLICGDISDLPFANNSVDVIMTVHALEPNGGRESELLSEILRVANKKVILFEPFFEQGSPIVQERMSSHGYVKNLEQTITSLGGVIQELVPLASSVNPLNPTFVFTVEPPDSKPHNSVGKQESFCPISHTPLTKRDEWYHSRESGISYPILQDISLLRTKHGVLTTAMSFDD
jgi:ubiquinone/menaquinone biosynthesis C-methylase UbiE